MTGVTEMPDEGKSAKELVDEQDELASVMVTV